MPLFRMLIISQIVLVQIVKLSSYKSYTKVAAGASHEQEVGECVTLDTDPMHFAALEKRQLLYSCRRLT